MTILPRHYIDQGQACLVFAQSTRSSEACDTEIYNKRHEIMPRPKPSDLSRDERFRIRVLHEAGLSYSKIQQHTNATISQIRRAVTKSIEPQKRSGRPPTLTEAQINELVNFVKASDENRRMSFANLGKKFNISEHVVRHQLELRGLKGRGATRKPLGSEVKSTTTAS